MTAGETALLRQNGPGLRSGHCDRDRPGRGERAMRVAISLAPTAAIIAEARPISRAFCSRPAPGCAVESAEPPGWPWTAAIRAIVEMIAPSRGALKMIPSEALTLDEYLLHL